jgi:cell division septum initiation protein DivIVA
MIDNKKIVEWSVSSTIFLLLLGRFLEQIPDASLPASIIEEISGISLTGTIIVGMYAAKRFIKVASNGGRIHRALVTSLAVTGGASISNFLILPLLFASYPDAIVSVFTQSVLVLGLLASSLLTVLLMFHRNHGSNNTNSNMTGDATFYQGKSIVFERGNRYVALCILKLTARSASLLASAGRASNGKPEDRFEGTGVTVQSYSHISSLWNNVQDLGIEFSVEGGLTSIGFFTLANDSRAETATMRAEAKAEKLKSIFQTRFNSKINTVQGTKLWTDYGSLIGVDPSSSIEIHREFLRIEDPQQSNATYVSVSALRGNDETVTMKGLGQSLSEKLVSAFRRECIAGSMVIHLEAIKPPSPPSEAKLLQKAREEPDLKILLELAEKKREAEEERNAQLTGYWKVSAYVIYRGDTPAQARLFQEKGDACIEAIYSSPGSSVVCEKLRGKSIANRLSKLMLRQDIGITTMKASSGAVSSLVNLPEQTVVGIQEEAIPDFKVPPKGELLEGEVTIGEVMSGENEICPLKLKLDDLMLHTVIFGETGFGKTRLIINLLQAMVKYNVAWTIIEMKGEYRPLTKLMHQVIYFRPGSTIAPLKLSLFDAQRENPEVHAKKIFTILKETFSTLFTDQNRDLSAQMERVFYEALVSYLTSETSSRSDSQKWSESRPQLTTVTNGGSCGVDSSRTWLGFNNWLKGYAEKHGLSSIPQINSTIQALLNRLNSFTRAPLSDVFNHEESNTNFNDLVKRRVIIDLSEIKRNGTPEDVRLISNIIAKYVATAAQQRGMQDQLKHLLIIDDALDVVPEILAKKTTAETGITEQMVLLLRTTGQGVIIATQRPNVSQNIVANSATKIFLRTTVDSEKAAKWLNLSGEQTNYLKVMPKREAIITTPRFSGPIRIKTAELDPPKANDSEIIIQNMVNYPVIYDQRTEPCAPSPTREAGLRNSVKGTDSSRSEVRKLLDTAEKKLQSGDYKGALRTDIKALGSIKERKRKEKDELKQKPADSQTTSETNPSQKCNTHPRQRLQRQSEDQTPYEPEKLPPLQDHIRQNATTYNFYPKTPNPTQKDPENTTRLTLKKAFKHQQEIIDENTLQARLNTSTAQQLREQTEPLITENLIGKITAPNYTQPYQATRLYYQITDHETRNIMQEYILTTIYKDLQSKGINTRWVDSNMELLITNENQHVITTWTNNIDQDATLSKLARIRQELQFEQPKELIIITPWKKDSLKLHKIIEETKLKGILTIPFNENETGKLVNHITVGTLL